MWSTKIGISQRNPDVCPRCALVLEDA
ncbi:MAG: zinc finger domain-containing protein [Desulfomonilaceae bacterium]